jgi:hypothetical protein
MYLDFRVVHFIIRFKFFSIHRVTEVIGCTGVLEELGQL